MPGVQFSQYPWQQFRVPLTGLNLDNVSAGGFTRCVNFDYQSGKMLTRKGFIRAGAYGSYITISSSNNGIMSIYQYDSTAGKLILITYDDKISKLTGGSDPLEFTGASNLDTDYTVDSFWKWGTLNNWAIAVCSDDSLITDGTNVRTLGVSGPSAAPSLAGSGSGTGFVAGIYRVSYSYVRSGTYGYESMKSPTGEVTIAADQQIDVTVVASGNAQISKVNIFCTGPGGTVEYFQQQENNASTTYHITSLVTSATSGYGADGIAPDDYGLPPQAADFLIVAGNRAWYGVASSSSVWRSNENQPETCSLLGVDFFGKNDGTEITGVGIYGDDLVVLKPTKLYLQNIWSFAITLFSENKGTIAPNSVQSITIGAARGVVFLSNRLSIDMFVGDSIVSLTDGRLTELFADIIDVANIDNVRSSYHPQFKRYSIIVPVYGGGYREFAFHFGGDSSDALGRWTEYSKPYADAMAIVTNADGVYKLLTSYKKSTIGLLYIHDEAIGTDDNEDILFEVKTVFYDFQFMGVQKILRRMFVDGIAFEYGQSGNTDSDLWGYLFNSRMNDSFVTSPFSSGSSSATSEQAGNESSKAFDASTSTSWKSEEGEGSGINIDLRLDVWDVLLGDLGGPVIYQKYYSGSESITWDWGSGNGYRINSFKVIPGAGGVRDFVFKGKVDGGGSFVTLYSGTCNYDSSFSYYLVSAIKYRYIQLLVTSIYSTSGVAEVKELDVIVKDDVSMQGYILSKEPGTEIRKATFDYYSEMDGFISTWKANNPSWATFYHAGTDTFDIDDNSNIAAALGFVSEASLDDATMVEILSDRLIEFNEGNNIFIDFSSGDSFSFESDFFADEKSVNYTTRPITIPAVDNYLVDDRVITKTQVDLFGKAETFSFSFKWESDFGFVLRGIDVWFSPMSFPSGGEND